MNDYQGALYETTVLRASLENSVTIHGKNYTQDFSKDYETDLGI